MRLKIINPLIYMKQQKKVPLSPRSYRRDPLKISLGMGYTIIFSGYIGLFVQAFFGGFSLFIIICDYGMLSKYQFMSYYSKIAPLINIIYIYVSVISCVVNTTFMVFGWILVKHRFVNIVLTVCVGLSIITLILSFSNIKITQIFYAMTQRQPDWFVDPNFDRNNNWRKKAFIPFQAKEIVRCILYIFQALLFIFGHQFANITFLKQFDLK